MNDPNRSSVHSNKKATLTYLKQVSKNKDHRWMNTVTEDIWTNFMHQSKRSCNRYGSYKYHDPSIDIKGDDKLEDLHGGFEERWLKKEHK